jgi:hypothetical protein
MYVKPSGSPIKINFPLTAPIVAQFSGGYPVKKVKN